MSLGAAGTSACATSKPTSPRHVYIDISCYNPSNPMRRSIRSFTAIATILFASAAFSQTLPTGVQKITSVEGITEYSLPNGLHFLLFPDESKPKLTVNITYLV